MALMAAVCLLTDPVSAKTPEDEAFQSAIARSYDISDPKYIVPLADCLRGLG